MSIKRAFLVERMVSLSATYQVITLDFAFPKFRNCRKNTCVIEKITDGLITDSQWCPGTAVSLKATKPGRNR